MIISWLSGGLGNQMFQYALGRIMAENNHDILRLDLSSFSIFNTIDTPRHFELDVFGLDYRIASRSEILRLSDANPLAILVNRYLGIHLNTFPASYKPETTHAYIPALLTTHGDAYLYGFWQSEKYFSAYRDLILKEFTFKAHATGKNKKLLQDIDKYNSISLHVRRGDYVTTKSASKFHGTCSPAYYLAAIKKIAQKVQSPIYYVFSDDIKWCKDNLHIPGKVIYVDHNHGKNSWEDMRLMSRCKHNIIANSSFSWWGAWLNQNPGKIVVAPKLWFKDTSVDIKDVIPDEWIKL